MQYKYVQSSAERCNIRSIKSLDIYVILRFKKYLYDGLKNINIFLLLIFCVVTLNFQIFLDTQASLHQSAKTIYMTLKTRPDSPVGDRSFAHFQRGQEGEFPSLQLQKLDPKAYFWLLDQLCCSQKNIFFGLKWLRDCQAAPSTARAARNLSGA